MTGAELLEKTLLDFERLADAQFAAGVRNFFKEPVDPYGVRSGGLAGIERGVYREVKSWEVAQRNAFFEELWKTGKLEAGAAVCHVCRRFSHTFGTKEFRLFETWLNRYVSNWSHTDGLASWLLAGCIANEPALVAQLRAWTRSPNRWVRRAAAVSLLQEAKQGRHTVQILTIANLLVKDRDEMVQKGVGWLLKETYPSRPEETVKFIVNRARKMSRLTIRYAAEKMTPNDREAVLGR